MKLKNISGFSLTLPISGVVLAINEIVDTSTFGDAAFVESCADEITTFKALGKIEAYDDTDTLITSNTEIIATLGGLKQDLYITNVEELAVAVSPHANRKFIFLSDTIEMKNREVIKKPFPGSISTVSVRPKDKNVSVQLFSDGITFPEEEVRKNAVFEFDFDFKMTDCVLTILSSHGKTDVEVYVDGDTYLDTIAIQELVDSWKEGSATHSTIDQYMFDSI